MPSEEEKRRYARAKLRVSKRYAKHRKSDPQWRKRIPPTALFWLRQWRWQGTCVVDESFKLYKQCNVVKHDTVTVKRAYRDLILGLAEDLDAEDAHFDSDATGATGASVISAAKGKDKNRGGGGGGEGGGGGGKVGPGLKTLQQLRAAEDEALSFQRSAFKEIRDAGWTQLGLLGRLWEEIRNASGKRGESGAFRTYQSLGIKLRRVGLKAKRNAMSAELREHEEKGEVDLAVVKLQALSRLCLRLGDTDAAVGHIESAVSKAGTEGSSALAATLATVLYRRFQDQLRSSVPVDAIGYVSLLSLFACSLARLPRPFTL